MVCANCRQPFAGTKGLEKKAVTCRDPNHIIETFLSSPVPVSEFPKTGRALGQVDSDIAMFLRKDGKRDCGIPYLAYLREPGIAWGRASTQDERENLALNILLHLCPVDKAVFLAKKFASTFILYIPPSGGRLNLTTLRRWIREEIS